MDRAQLVFTVAGAAKEAKRRAAADLKQREVAPTILSPGDLLGEYDAARLLMTTLGGVLRAVSDADLRAFAQNAAALGKKFKGGITPQGIIDASRPEDIKRANLEIRTAVPYRWKGGMLDIQTNAGPNSDVSAHYLKVQLVNFDAMVASPATPAQAADRLTKMQVRIDCDCGRNKFWFRYIATIGQFNAGRPETGFPKIRNPQLTGVGCKHMLRAMANMRLGLFKRQIAQMVEEARRSIKAQTATRQVPPSAVKAIIAEQAKGVPRIRTRAQLQAAAKRKPNAKLKAVAKKAIAAIEAQNRTDAKIARAYAQQLRRMNVISQRRYEIMLARIKD